MPGLRSVLFTLCGLAFLPLLAGGPAIGAPKSDLDDGDRRALMRVLLGEIQVLLPLAADPKAFEDPDKRQDIAHAAKVIGSAASMVEEHASGSDNAEARYLSRALAVDARLIESRVRSGHLGTARESVLRAVGRCAACHTRLPEPALRDVMMGKPGYAATEKLPPETRWKVWLATRRFDEAMRTAEVMLDDKKVHLAARVEILEEYIATSVRTLGDVQRPRTTVRKMAARPDVWGKLEADLMVWDKTLASLHRERKKPRSLERAKTILGEGDRLAESPSDRVALVHYAAASGMLHEVAVNKKLKANDRAEAMLLLVLTDLRLQGEMPLPLASAWLEDAIRTAPGSTAARRAYDLLYEATLRVYDDGESVVLPEEERKRLDVLSRLSRSKI